MPAKLRPDGRSASRAGTAHRTGSGPRPLPSPEPCGAERSRRRDECRVDGLIARVVSVPALGLRCGQSYKPKRRPQTFSKTFSIRATLARVTRRPTIHDVAAAAGVSVATVSKAINGRYGISLDTSRRVLQVVEDGHEKLAHQEDAEGAEERRDDDRLVRVEQAERPH